MSRIRKFIVWLGLIIFNLPLALTYLGKLLNIIGWSTSPEDTMVLYDKLDQMPLYFIYAMAFVAWGVFILGPPFWANHKHKLASNKFVNLIFQEEQHLTFKEIALRWEDSTSKNRSAEQVLNWLISDIWLGEFEDKHGKSTLSMLDGYDKITKGGDEAFLSKHQVDATRHRLFSLFARDCPQLYREKFGQASSHIADADWSTQRDQVDWNWLSTIKVHFFNEAIPIESFRTRVLEQLTIARLDFADWLRKTQRPLPEHW